MSGAPDCDAREGDSRLDGAWLAAYAVLEEPGELDVYDLADRCQSDDEDELRTRERHPNPWSARARRAANIWDAVRQGDRFARKYFARWSRHNRGQPKPGSRRTLAPRIEQRARAQPRRVRTHGARVQKPGARAGDDPAGPGETPGSSCAWGAR